MLVLLTAARSREDTAGSSHMSARIMSPVPLVSSPDQDLHFVLCVFGHYGWAYVETDPAEADASTIVRKLLQGHFGCRIATPGRTTLLMCHTGEGPAPLTARCRSLLALLLPCYYRSARSSLARKSVKRSRLVSAAARVLHQAVSGPTTNKSQSKPIR
jgi:hypothetical protein